MSWITNFNFPNIFLTELCSFSFYNVKVFLSRTIKISKIKLYTKKSSVDLGCGGSGLRQGLGEPLLGSRGAGGLEEGTLGSLRPSGWKAGPTPGLPY